MITGDIESIAFGGSGILKDKGLVIFIPYTAPQDRVTATILSQKKNFAHGSLLTIDQPSPDRTDPLCPYFGTCGGCQFQHIQYSAQLEIKRRFIADALQRIGSLSLPIEPIIPAPHSYNYRCHITLSLKPEKAGFHAGYISSNNTQLIPVTQCPIFCPSNDPILSTVQSFASQLDNQGIQEGSIRLFKSGEQYILACAFSPRPPSNSDLSEAILQAHPEIQAILIKSPQGIQTYGTAHCQTQSLNISAYFSPYGFVQNFPQQRDAIYRAILENTPPAATKILDLYCGIGITSLLFAQGATVIGIESNPESIAMAKMNAQHNQIDTATFHIAKVEKKAAFYIEALQPDSALVNPPREGLNAELIRDLCGIPHIQYLSCMPATLARDLKIFCSNGFTVEKIRGYDMFPQTTHVETLVSLKKRL